jgi:hypothetical protein
MYKIEAKSETGFDRSHIEGKNFSGNNLSGDLSLNRS